MFERCIVFIYFNMFNSINIVYDVDIKTTPWFFKHLHNRLRMLVSPYITLNIEKMFDLILYGKIF